MSIGAFLTEDITPAGQYFKRISDKRSIAGALYDSSNNSFSHFSIWDIGVWNKFCLQKLTSELSILINEEEVLKEKNIDQSRLSGNIRLMNLKINENTSYPMNGEINDLQIWDRIVQPSENDSYGNILNWNDLNITEEAGVKVFDDEIDNKDTFQTYDPAIVRSITESASFCMERSKEIATAKDKKMLKALKILFNSSEDLEDQHEIFFTGHVKYLNKWINIKTYQQLEENDFNITGLFC